jgi:hypothetical protein
LSPTLVQIATLSLYESSDNLFFVLANAASHTGSISWLEKAYVSAEPYAKTLMTAIGVKSCIVFLHRKITKNLTSVESLIEDIGDVAALDHESQKPEPTKVGRFVA